MNELKRTISKQLTEISMLNSRISELEDIIRQKDEQINRLLEYTELSEEDMKKQIQNTKNVSAVFNYMNDISNLMPGFGAKFGL